jgi:hypothetical protein
MNKVFDWQRKDRQPPLRAVPVQSNQSAAEFLTTRRRQWLRRRLRGVGEAWISRR